MQISATAKNMIDNYILAYGMAEMLHKTELNKDNEHAHAALSLTLLYDRDICVCSVYLVIFPGNGIVWETKKNTEQN